jgi:putative acetyltransferase
MHNITIRPEQPGDDELIDAVVCAAFNSMDEANLIRMMRQHYPAFDPRYSLAAWERNTLVGHALFSPARIRLLDRTVLGLGVGPVAVHPDRQRRGIGALLMKHGHEIGRRDGFALAFLYGHPSYYPRFTYRACFGLAKVMVDVDKLPQPDRAFTRSPVRKGDIPWLVERQNREWHDVDFGWLWGTSLSEWTLPFVNAVIWQTEDGRRAAYTLGPAGRDRGFLLFAEDPDLARQVLYTVRPALLRHHPSGWLARNVLDEAWSSAQATAIPAAMACELEEGILDPLLQALQARQRPPGYALFPLPFLSV